ncbi:MAG: phosphate acyltransferase PlsX [Planctomycetes bacterium]|nr:phosphate acyltransferase PlsX [Planctomycetota bacterium]
MRIAIDAMGGDHAPEEIVRGAIEGARLASDATVLLVGDEKRIEPLLADRPANVEIRHASQVVAMDEDPARGLRGKPDSSIRVSLGLVKKGEADAVISAGNTGALVGGATVPLLGLGSLEGVKRPGIAVPVPTDDGICALMDAGANKSCKPIHLLQYAVMGSVYIRYLRPDLPNPRVALLNIGEERTKGNELVRETYEAFEKSGLNFVGNIEPHKMFGGKADVVVTDGFTGNLVLKTCEGTNQFLMKLLSGVLKSLPEAQKAVTGALEKLDFSEYGGAPLLGVRGVVIKAHGRSKARAIANAIRVTAEFVRGELNRHIVEGLKKLSWWGRFSDWFRKPADSLENP